MKYMEREYYCPVCGNVQLIGTNHEGTVYSGCKVCNNSEMYCKNGVKKEVVSQYVIHPYYLNTDKEDEKKEYLELVKKLKKEGYEKWESVHDTRRDKWINLLLHNGVETLDIFYSFDGEVQHLGNRGRVFNWYECIYPNSRIKKGYYLVKVEGCEK